MISFNWDRYLELSDKLDRLAKQNGTDYTVVDHLPPAEREEWRKMTKELDALAEKHENQERMRQNKADLAGFLLHHES